MPGRCPAVDYPPTSDSNRRSWISGPAQGVPQPKQKKTSGNPISGAEIQGGPPAAEDCGGWEPTDAAQPTKATVTASGWQVTGTDWAVIADSWPSTTGLGRVYS